MGARRFAFLLSVAPLATALVAVFGGGASPPAPPEARGVVRTASGIRPKATYRWSASEGRYVGPSGSGPEHFLRIQGTEIWSELQRLRSEGLAFPADPDFEPPDDPLAGWGANPEIARQVAAAKPYEMGTLRGLSDAEILRYMGKGKSAFDLELAGLQTNQLPDRFWERPPREATLALAERNRTETHRRSYALSLRAVSGKSASAVPELQAGTIRTDERSAPCYVRTRDHLFLKVDSSRSYLAFARTARAGTVFFHVVDDPILHDLDIVEVPYRDARQVLNVVRHLPEIQSSEIDEAGDGMFMSFSTADGQGKLELRGPDGKVLEEMTGTLWGNVPGRWIGHFDGAVALNLASHLLGSALPQRLGDRWKRVQPAHRALDDGRLGGPATDPKERKRLSRVTRELLSLFSRDERDLPLEIVEGAVRATGENVLAEHEGRIEGIRRSVSALTLSARSRGLRAASDLALRQIRTARNPSALEAWALSRETGNGWALRQLIRRDPDRAVEPLLRWLDRSEGEEARQVFGTLARIAPERARQVAAASSGPRREMLATVRPGGPGGGASGAVTDLAARLDPATVNELVRVAVAEGTSWEQRGEAIRILVPPEDPLRNPGPEIDDVLVRLLDPAPGDDLRFTVGRACRALALRGHAPHFERIRARLAVAGPHDFEPILSALSLMASRGSDERRGALAEAVRPHLHETDRMLNELLWSIWAADLRALQPDLIPIATASPDDVEGDKASSSGGGIRPVRERYHLARKLLAIWTEPDALTRTKLLVALAFEESFYPMGFGDEIERVERLRKSLREALESLSPEERAAAVAFLRTCEEIAGEGAELCTGLPDRANPRAAVLEVLAP